MSWADYGFTGFDMALKPIDLTLQGMFLALKERLDAAGVVNSHYDNFSNGHYIFWPDSDGSRTASQANRYNGVESMIGSVFNGHFIDSKLSNYFNFYYDSGYKDRVLDNACDYLNNSGFQTTKIPLSQDWKLTQYNKHWLIQRKTMIDMMRYWLVQLPESLFSGTPKIVYTYQETPWQDGNPIYQDRLEDVFTNLSTPINWLLDSIDNISIFTIHYDYIYSLSKFQYYCERILNDIYIEKNFVDNAINAHNDSDIRVEIHNSRYDNLHLFDGRFLLQNVLLNNTYTLGNLGTFYKLNFPYSFNDLVNIILDNASYFDENHRLMAELAQPYQYLYQVKDGADSFQFLDPIA